MVRSAGGGPIERLSTYVTAFSFQSLTTSAVAFCTAPTIIKPASAARVLCDIRPPIVIASARRRCVGIPDLSLTLQSSARARDRSSLFFELVSIAPTWSNADMQRGYEQFCPIAKAAEVVATRWTPLILRELMANNRSFN